MSVAFPLALLLLPLPLLLRRLLAPREERVGAVVVPPALAESLRPAEAPRAARTVRRLALGLAWGLVVLALAGPRELRALDVTLDSGRDIVLAIDLSGSMAIEDFDLDGARVSRLDAVKAVASRFVLGREGDRIGLVVFGERAYAPAALTHDVAAVAHTVRTAAIGVSGKSTAVADGLGLAIKRLREREATSRVVILLSDGRDTSGLVDPVAAAVTAKRLGIRVHTIALGPDDLATAPDPRSAVDTETLTRIAEVSGGEVFRVRDTADLVAVAAAIDRLEPSPADAPPIEVWHELWVWPAGLAVLAVLGLLVLDRRETA
ncbi:MAG: VWA domain-containing protein [Paracoccaceae bacterium]